MPKLFLRSGPRAGSEFALRERTLIGSGDSNDVILRDRTVARNHARIDWVKGEAFLFDLDSAAGTYVNGQRVHNKVLKPGDEISLGSCVIVYQDQNPDPRIGKTLGHYEILGRLGSGGAGTVYLAEDQTAERLVALKILKRSLTTRVGYVDRFRREANTVLKLSHPNIVHAYEFGEMDGAYFYSMEYISGFTVRDLLKRDTTIGVDRTLDIAIQTNQALNYASKFGIVHLDIKPKNLLINKVGRVKVADFGIARIAGRPTAQEGGLVMGTRYYISPEHAQGKPVDSRSDIYSLGATLYHMLSGRPPFMGKDTADVIEQHVSAEAPRLETLKPDLPPGLCAIVRRSLGKRPEDRFQSAADLLAALEQFREARDDSFRRNASARPSRS